MNQNGLNQIFQELLASGPLLAPHFTLIFTICLVLILDLIAGNKWHKISGIASLTGIVIALMLSIKQYAAVPPDWQFEVLGQLVFTRFAIFFQFLFLLAACITLLLSTFDTPLRHRAEFYILTLALTLAGMTAALVSHLLLIYLSVELLSITAYALTAIRSTSFSAEGAIKYIIYGGTASASMLYGISWLYGLTGTLQLQLMTFGDQPTMAVMVAIILFVGGLLFKASVVPFHLWVPDVYQAAPLPAVALFSFTPKVAAFLILAKWLAVIPVTAVAGEAQFVFLVWAAALSMAFGNIMAMRQHYAMRLMGYSSIAHTGYLLAALLSLTNAGLDAFAFYVVVYLFMNSLAFLLILLAERNQPLARLELYQGMARKYPYYTVLMIIAMIALTGLPPTAGFTAKWLAMTAVLNGYELSQQPELLFLFIFGLLNVVASLFYYLKIPYYMIFRQETTFLPSKKFNRYAMISCTIFTLPLLLWFIKPEWLMSVIENLNFISQ